MSSKKQNSTVNKYGTLKRNYASSVEIQKGESLHKETNAFIDHKLIYG